MEIDVAGILARLQVDREELELLINEIVEHELKVLLADIADDSRLLYVVVTIGEDNILKAARNAVSRWMEQLR